MDKKRLLAYLFDITLLLIIIYIISMIIPKNSDVIILENSLTDLNVLLTSKEITMLEYFKSYSNIVHDIDILKAFYSITNAFFIIIYFVLIPFFRGGLTYGQSILKIRVVTKDNTYPSIKQLMLRSFVVNGLLYMLVSLMLLYIIPKNMYFLVVSILGIIQLFIVIKSAFMIRYSKNKEGLQDLVSHTYVIENIEVK